MTESITRLHISPLTPALLDSILAPSIRPLATDISFHNIATFPENDYGFVSLPAMEADKLKKKLNGSILKGRKFKVEAARADPKKTKTETKVDSDKTSENIASRKSTKTSSKRKAEESVLEGHELPGDRHVKRGWTEPASAKRLKKQKKTDAEASKTKLQTKSKYTEKAECLFKMKMPPNKMSEAVSKKTKSKKSKAPNEVVVHEFAQTVTHPSFLKSTIGGKPVTAKFEDGKGWVDEDGNVQEETSSKKTRTEDYHPGKKDGAKERAISKEKSRTKVVKAKKKSPSPDETSSSEEEDQEPDWTSSSGSSDSDNSTSDSDSDIESDDSSSSGASSLSDREGEITKNAQATIKSKAIEFDKGEAENDSISESDSAQESPEVDSGTKASESSQPPETTTQAKEVHPLEALFKRTPTEKSVPESPKPTFSFFADNDDDIEDENDDVAPVSLEPLTPFSKQDRQFRGLRSGAPTLDTAVFNRRKFLVPAEGDNADEDMDMDTDEDDDNTQTLGEESPSKARGETATQQLEESDFVKWFWENRGDNNRAWKRRRREAAKEKRQRENRRKGLKGRG